MKKDNQKTGTAKQERSKRRYSPEQREKARRSYQEIGQSIARAVLEGRQSEDWAWLLVGDLGLYERWELDLWLMLYRQERRSALAAQAKQRQRLKDLEKQYDEAKPRKLLKALRKQSNG